jgi:hypothetical protein
MPAFLVSAPGKDRGASARSGLVVEKPGAAWVKQAPSGSFDSAPSGAVAPDKSMRRCARDDVFVGVLMKNIPGRLTLMGLPSWAKLSRPCGTKLANPGSHTPSLGPEVRSSFPLWTSHPFSAACLAPEVRLSNRPWRNQPRKKMTSPCMSRKAYLSGTAVKR